MPDWERLPENTEAVCWRTDYGWSGTPPHCGKKAAWLLRATCGCGECDMSIQHCEECHQKYQAEQKRLEEWGKRNVVHKTLPGGLTIARRRKDVKDN